MSELHRVCNVVSVIFPSITHMWTGNQFGEVPWVFYSSEKLIKNTSTLSKQAKKANSSSFLKNCLCKSIYTHLTENKQIWVWWVIECRGLSRYQAADFNNYCCRQILEWPFWVNIFWDIFRSRAFTAKGYSRSLIFFRM